jgi:transketolase
MREYFSEELLELTKYDSRVYAIDADLANSVKTDSVAINNPEKFIQIGIAEQNMVGIAAGMATVGLQPWVITFGSFLTKRALDQITVSVAQPNLDVKLIGAYTGILNSRVGKTHQAIEDIAIMRTIPNMTILSPADGIELSQMMHYANKTDGPFYIRVARESENIINPYSTNENREFFKDQLFIPGHAYYMLRGKDATIISTGTHTRYALESALELKKEGIEVSLIHMPSIKPLDIESIMHASFNTGAIITVEDHSIIGGLGSAVSEVLSEYCPAFMLRIGINDVNIESGSNDELLEKYGLTARHISEKVKKCITLKNKRRN